MSPASLKQTFNCVHIIQLDSAVVVQRHSPGFHLSNGLQAGAGHRGLKSGAQNLPFGLTHSITPRALQMSFLGQCLYHRSTLTDGLPGPGFSLGALLCALDPARAPCPFSLSIPALSNGAAHHGPRLHTASPMNKELRKFIRK